MVEAVLDSLSYLPLTINDEEVPEQFKQMEVEAAEVAKKWNEVPPKVRPHRNRKEAEQKYHNLEMATFHFNQQKQAPNLGRIRTTFVTGESHSCALPFDKLTPIFLAQMEVPKIHLGKYLVCRTISNGLAKVATKVLVEDLKGDVEELGLYNFRPVLDRDGSWIAPETIIAIKEPYLKYGNGLMNELIIHVDSPSDALFIHDTDEKSLREVGAMKWYSKEVSNFEKLKAFGNNCYKQKDHSKALQYYDRALRIHSSADESEIEINKRHAIIHLNKAAVFLELKRFYEAYKEAKTAIETEGAVINVEKALYRLAIAAYGLREWDTVCKHFQELLQKFPNTKTDVSEQLARALLRVKESKGVYDIERLYQEACVEKKRRLDIADYRGPISIEEIPNKGKGYVATEDIAKGTLLLAEKAFSCAFDDEFEGTLICIDTITNVIQDPEQLLTTLGVIHNLRYNPSKTCQFYSLYAGPGFPRSNDQQFPEGFIDVARIERICAINRFNVGNHPLFLSAAETEMSAAISKDNANNEKIVAENKPTNGAGLYIQASFFNHSCLANATRIFHGDLMMVYALSDIKKGGEITIAYHNLKDSYSKRARHFQQSYGFTCDCALCEWERKDPKQEERNSLIDQCQKYIGMPCTNPDKVIAEVTPILQKMESMYELHEFRHYLFEPLYMLSASYLVQKNYNKSAELIERALACRLLAEVHPLWSRVQVQLAQNYVCLRRFADAKNCVQNAMTVCRQMMGVEQKLFQRLFPLCSNVLAICNQGRTEGLSGIPSLEKTD